MYSDDDMTDVIPAVIHQEPSFILLLEGAPNLWACIQSPDRTPAVRSRRDIAKMDPPFVPP